MLWAGADPYEPGPDMNEIDFDPEDEDWMNALDYAAFHDHYEVFELKQIKLDPQHPRAAKLLKHACFSRDARILAMLLEKGFSPGERADEGTALIQMCLNHLDFFIDRWDSVSIQIPDRGDPNRNLDTRRAREKMKMIHLLAKNGANGSPKKRMTSRP